MTLQKLASSNLRKIAGGEQIVIFHKIHDTFIETHILDTETQQILSLADHCDGSPLALSVTDAEGRLVMGTGF